MNPALLIALSLQFVDVPPGTFIRGEHRVTFTHAISIATTEVTQAQWKAVMGTNPSHFRGRPDAPVENVTFIDVQQFIARLNARGGARYRLPTEAEWEYACRAGTTTRYSTGNFLTDKDANYDARYPLPGQPKGKYRERTMDVRSFPPNAWGVYDMHGNVWEWCEDDYCPYPDRDVVDPPPAHCDSGLKVIRGGSWYFNAESAESALRYTHAADLKGFSIGFRLVRVPGLPSALNSNYRRK